AGAGATNTHFDVFHAMFLCGRACLLGGNLRGERRALARAAETAAARGRPGQCVALTIGDRDDRVVERSMDVRDRIEHVLASLLRLLGAAAGSLRRGAATTGFLIGHVALNLLCLTRRSVEFHCLLARTLPGTCVGTCTLAT